jgi:hypothetical protein
MPALHGGVAHVAELGFLSFVLVEFRQRSYFFFVVVLRGVRLRAGLVWRVASSVDCDASDLEFEAFEPEPRDTDDGERRMVIPR